MDPEIQFFPARVGLRAWFERNHATAREVWVGFHKVHVADPSIQYLEAVEEALCFGWIDTTVRRVDDDRYAHRFTPRRERSRWSDVNVLRFQELARAGRVTPAGRRAFDARAPADPRRYSYEARPKNLSRAYLQRFRASEAAWSFFESEPPSYRRLAEHWVMSAVREETRERRFAELVEASRRSTRPRAFLVERAARDAAETRPVTRSREGRKRPSRRRPGRATRSR
jgi:uncharacterized protein YdeI (YjbR/CyaY-like superfamily)